MTLAPGVHDAVEMHLEEERRLGQVYFSEILFPFVIRDRVLKIYYD